jgi:lipid-A-disaccharide synthase
MKAAEFIITASGTTSLEAAILNTPQIICYQSAWTSYFLAKYIFKIEFVGLPNIIYGSEVVPELLQNDFQAEKIVKIALEWLNNQKKLNKIKNKLQTVSEKLGGGGAVNKTADLLLREGGLKNSR